VIKMPRGRNFWGPGFWKWGYFGYPYFGYGAYPYFGWGRGNPFPFCRWFPWLPRWWWTGMYGPITPFNYPASGTFSVNQPTSS